MKVINRSSVKSAGIIILLGLMSISPVTSADDSLSSKKLALALIDTLNPELASLPEKEKYRIVGDALRFAQTVSWRPDAVAASLTKISGIKASLDNRLSELDKIPRKQGEKSKDEMLYESRALALVVNLIEAHQAGGLNLDSLQKELGVKQSIHQGPATKRLLKIAKK